MPTYQEGGYSVEIDWSNYERLCGEIQGVPDKVTRLTALELEHALKREAPKGITGNLQASWRAEQIRSSKVFGGLFTVERGTPGSAGSEWIVGSPLDYAAYVNDGTKPHAPPKDAIKEWAEFRGLPWYPIWLSICERGTKANPYIDRSIELVNGRIPMIMNQAIREMKV